MAQLNLRSLHVPRQDKTYVKRRLKETRGNPMPAADRAALSFHQEFRPVAGHLPQEGLCCC